MEEAGEGLLSVLVPPLLPCALLDGLGPDKVVAPHGPNGLPQLLQSVAVVIINDLFAPHHERVTLPAVIVGMRLLEAGMHAFDHLTRPSISSLRYHITQSVCARSYLVWHARMSLALGVASQSHVERHLDVHLPVWHFI
jgi:hypothetical protein